MNHGVDVHDIVQADPEKCRWGAILLFVTEVRDHGVFGHFCAPLMGQEGGPATFKGKAWLKLSHGDYIRIGRAAWVEADDALIKESE